MSYADRLLDQLEEVVDGMTPEVIRNSPPMRIIRAVREELIDCGLDQQNSDMFVARMPIKITGNLTEEQIERLVVIARKLVRQTYTAFEREGFCTRAIVEMASEVVLSFEA